MNPSTRQARRVDGALQPVFRVVSGAAQPSASAMGIRLITILGQRHVRNWLILAAIAAILLLSVLALVAPRAGMLVLLVLLGLAIWRWAQIELAAHDLAFQLARGETLSKLEVGQGGWGALCHAVNVMVQQQRLFQRSQSLLPSLPASIMNGLLEGRISTTHTSHVATVLVIGCENGLACSVAEAAAQWDALAALAQTAAAPYDALVQRCGDRLLLVFGLGRQSSITPGLRSALQTVVALRSQWAAQGAGYQPLTIGLSAGPLVASAIDGLGYGVVGQPITQAQRLYGLAAAHPEHTTLCDQETYLGLRQLGVEGNLLNSHRTYEKLAAYVVEIRDL